jgi:hypothetical protein
VDVVLITGQSGISPQPKKSARDKPDISQYVEGGYQFAALTEAVAGGANPTYQDRDKRPGKDQEQGYSQGKADSHEEIAYGNESKDCEFPT